VSAQGVPFQMATGSLFILPLPLTIAWWRSFLGVASIARVFPGFIPVPAALSCGGPGDAIGLGRLRTAHPLASRAATTPQPSSPHRTRGRGSHSLSSSS